MWLLDAFHRCVAEEIVPAIHTDLGGARLPVVVAGASIGAFNALAVLCRFPQLFSLAVCMSGTYWVDKFIPGDYTDDLYYASPMDFLPGLEGPVLDELRRRFVLFTSGQGAWEDVGESWAAADVLGRKGIPNRVDAWGGEWDHEWTTWWRMLPQYLDEFVRSGEPGNGG
jgi:esterase/lipase superfamily enzyme